MYNSSCESLEEPMKQLAAVLSDAYFAHYMLLYTSYTLYTIYTLIKIHDYTLVTHISYMVIH